MTEAALADRYRAYIACLNNRELSRLGDFVADGVAYNGERVGLEGYRLMIAGDYEAIPDLHFVVQILVAAGPRSRPAWLSIAIRRAGSLGWISTAATCGSART